MPQTTQQIADRLQALSLRRKDLDDRKQQLQDQMSDARIDIIEINLRLRDVAADQEHLMNALVASMQPSTAARAQSVPPLVFLR